MDNWIPAKDRLPTTARSVLIYRARTGAAEGYYSPTSHGWYQFRHDISCNDVQYWQDMPEPPEEATKKRRKKR